MSLHAAEQIARALLYEGYLLYPYRPSSLKNRYRFPFGALYPSACCQGGSDRAANRTEVLVDGDGGARIEAGVRFLQLTGDEAQGWQRGIEREVSLPAATLASLLAPIEAPFSFAADGIEVVGSVSLSSLRLAERLWRVTACVRNTGDFQGAERGAILLRSLISAHTVLAVKGGALRSAYDAPPEGVASCASDGTFPVLVGSPGARDVVLASPIILPDYPRVAPESPGDLFDATEIDEILSLRILTLTDEEKREMAASDPRAAALLARTEQLSAGDFAALHGALRDEPRAPVTIVAGAGSTGRGAVKLGPGAKVRLCPRAGADVFDIVLRGKVATIQSIEQDMEDIVYLTVTVDEDPGKDLGAHGHRFFFRPDEVEAIEAPADAEARRS